MKKGILYVLLITILLFIGFGKVLAAGSTTVSSWTELANAVNSGNYSTIMMKTSSDANWTANSTIKITREITLKTDDSNTGVLIIKRGTDGVLFEVTSARFVLNAQNKSLTIDGTYSTQTKQIITATNNANISITNVSMKYNNTNGNGGAISVTNSTLALSGCHISGNKAKFGGGVIVSGSSSSATITNTEIFNNTALEGSGGGLYAYGTIIVNNSSFTNNVAATYGGGFIVKTSAIIKNSTFNNNTATGNSGGALRVDGEATITGGEIKNNKAATGGAGIDFGGSDTPVNYSNITMSGNMVGTEEVNVYPDINSPNNVDWKNDPSLKIEEMPVEVWQSFPRDGTGPLAPHKGATQGMATTDKFILLVQWTENEEPTKIHVFNKKTLRLVNTIVVDSAVYGYTFGHANDLSYDKDTGFVYVYTYYKATNGKVQVAKFKVNDAGEMTDLSLFDTPLGFTGIAFDNDHDQILISTNRKINIYDKEFNLKSSFATPTPLVVQGIGYWKDHVYFACYEAGVPNQYQTIFNYNEKHSNLIYMYDLKGNLVKTLYIPKTRINGEIEDVDFLDNGEMVINYNYEGITVLRSNYPIQIKSVTVDKKPTKLKYIQKEEDIDLSGLVLGVTLNNEDKSTVSSLKDVSVEGFDNSVLGTQTVNLVYKGKKIPLQIEIVAPQIIDEPTQKEIAVEKKVDNPKTGESILTVIVTVIILIVVYFGCLFISKRSKKLHKV